MRKLLHFSIAMALLTAGVACTKEVGGTAKSADGVTVVTVGLPQTKTALASDNGVYKMVWSEGDVISINGVASQPVPSRYVGQRNAEFTFNATLSAPYNLLYGALAGDDPDLLSFKGLQGYAEGSFDPDAAPMYAASDDITKLAPSGLFAALRFTLSSAASDTLKTIIVTSLGSESISGTFRAGRTDGLYDGTITAVAGSTSVSMTPEVPVVLGPEEKEFFITIPAGRYSAGFQAYIVNTAGETMQAKFLTSGEYEVLPNKVYSLPASNFTANTGIFIIADVDDLIRFTSLGGSDNDKVEGLVVSDIDVTGSDYKAFNSFYGYLDGGGHTISGLTASLFGNFYGTVKNLVLEGNINYSGVNADNDSGTDYGVGMLCHYAYKTGTHFGIENITTRGSITLSGPTATAHAFQIGAIAGASNGVPLTGCTNYADVNVTSGYLTVKGTDLNLMVGGLVGTVQSDVTANLTGCVNYGSVNAGYGVSDAGSNAVYVGGVAGRVSVKSSVTDIANHGAVTCNGTSGGNVYIGGCFGGCSGVCDGIKNHGPVLNNATTTSLIQVGGVVGNSFGAGSRNIINEGTVTSKDVSCTYVFTGGVAAYVNSQPVSGLTNNGNVTIDNIKVSAGTGFAVGGVLGQAAAEILDLSDLTNNGKVLVKPINSGSNSAVRYDIGGVLGYQYRDSGTGNHKFSKFVNNGDVEVQGIAYANPARIGGCIGNAVNAKLDTQVTEIDQFSNSGNITVTAGVQKNLWAGGIIGDARYSGTVTVSGCGNTGNLLVTGYAGKDRLCLGGVMGQLIPTNAPVNVSVEECTNTGKIGLYENVTDSYRPSAGGIIGQTYGTTTLTMALSVRNCRNDGTIERSLTGVTKQSLARNTDAYYDRITCCGGIVGSLGYYATGSNTYCYVSGTIENCVNNGDLAFNRKTAIGATVCCETNQDGTNVYHGGIAGMAFAATGHQNTIKSCTNNGRIMSTYGKDGGIVGFQRSHTLVTGTKDAYTVNYGQIHHQGASVEASTGTPYGYCGGITGYIFGDGTNVIEYAANYGFMGTNYGSGGIVGLFCSSTSKLATVRYCKAFHMAKASSTAAALYGGGGKSALIAGAGPKEADGGPQTWDGVSNVAVGGTLWRYNNSTWAPVTITSDNYMNYCGSINWQPVDPNFFAEHNITYWDGTSATPWE